ncbi:MAG TPA: class I SAM-dependent methyltransferase [Gaiellaceae bacterium]|jgi:SAM-dependent methyltransferase
MRTPPQNDPELVRREYADETGLNERFSIWARRTGPQPQDVAFDELLAAAPRRVLDAGCGRGDFAERLASAGLDVVGLDQSERMIELTRARGIEAVVGDIARLPFPEASFDAACANHVLYHLPDVDRGLAELARVLRPGARLVATTNAVGSLHEMWDLVGRNLSDRWEIFMRETGEAMLRRHFAAVRMIPLDGTVDLTADEMRNYVAHSVAHKHLAANVPDYEGTMTLTASGAVFVASRAA